MTIYFISDVHLKAQNPQLAENFFYFLQHCIADATALYILGDFFDLWLGDDDHNAFNESIIVALASVHRKKIPAFFIHGNHDFLLGKKFAQRAKIQLLEEPALVEHYGKKLLLIHGDTLCTNDRVYQQNKKKYQHPLTKKLFLTMPLVWRKKFALYLTKKSQHHFQHVNPKVIDADEEEIQKVFAYYKVNYLIHGHTHRPSIQLYYQPKTEVIHQRIVLADWNATAGNYLQLNANGDLTLQYF